MQAFQGDRVQLATRIPHALHRAIRIHTIEQSTSLGAFVTEALVEHLARCQSAGEQKQGRDTPQVTLARRLRGAQRREVTES
jgi:hypothetical protein